MFKLKGERQIQMWSSRMWIRVVMGLFFSHSALNTSETLLLALSLNSDCFSLAAFFNDSPIRIVLEPTETECCCYVFTWSRYNFLFRALISENIKPQ